MNILQCVCRQSVKAYLKYVWLKLRHSDSIYLFPAQNGRRKCMVMVDIMGNVSDMGRPSTFTKDQMVNVVLWWGELKIMLKVRRKFVKHFGINCHPREVLTIRSFQTVLDRFLWESGPEEIRRAVANVMKRTAACIQCGGGHFEHLLEKAQNETAKE